MARRRDDSVGRMRALVAELPTTLVDGFRAGQETPLPPDSGRLFACGLGASAAAADLARSILDADGRATLEVVRADDLPRAVDARSAVVVVSYSGETLEALRAYEVAGRRGARRLVVTSGGRLGERATEDGTPVVLVPGGKPPRAALGSLLGGLLGALDGSFPETNEGRVRAAAESARHRFSEFAAPSGTAAVIARQLGTRLPVVVAESVLGAVARRWASQIEENAKRLAFALEAPELFHNALVGFGAMAVRDAARTAVVALGREPTTASLREGFRALERAARRRRVAWASALLPGDDLLETVILGVVLGDLVSVELARRSRVDPFPIEEIARLRDRLSH